MFKTEKMPIFFENEKIQSYNISSNIASFAQISRKQASKYTILKYFFNI